MRRTETVQTVMTRNPATVGPGTPFKEVAGILARLDISAVPVVDEAGAPIGIVSEADLLAKTRNQDRDRPPPWFAGPRRRHEWARAQALTAGELMSQHPLAVGPDMPLAWAARELAAAGVRRLLVVDDAGRLVGIVSRRDLLRPFLRDDEQIRSDVLHDILERAMWLRPTAMEVTVERGVVTLAGTLERRSETEVVARLTHALPGVVAVRNRLSYELDDVEADLGTSNLLH